MKTAEEKAKKYADSIIQVVVPGTGVTFTVDDLNEFAQRDYLAGYNEAMRRRDPKEELPEKAGCDFCRDEQGYTIGNMYICDKCGRQVP